MSEAKKHPGQRIEITGDGLRALEAASEFYATTQRVLFRTVYGVSSTYEDRATVLKGYAKLNGNLFTVRYDGPYDDAGLPTGMWTVDPERLEPVAKAVNEDARNLQKKRWAVMTPAERIEYDRSGREPAVFVHRLPRAGDGLLGRDQYLNLQLAAHERLCVVKDGDAYQLAATLLGVLHQERMARLDLLRRVRQALVDSNAPAPSKETFATGVDNPTTDPHITHMDTTPRTTNETAETQMTTNDFEYTGWRYMDSSFDAEPTVGDILPTSYVWDGDEQTDDQLDGTCAFETREQVENYAQHSKGCGWLVQLGGNSMSWGSDMVGEVIIRDAVVIAVEKW
jgi:hypothetical protein